MSASSKASFNYKNIENNESFYFKSKCSQIKLEITMPIIGLPPLKNPFCVATVTSNSVFFNSADEMMYSNVAS